MSIAFTTSILGINGVFAGLLLAHTLRFLAFYLISQHIAYLPYQLSFVLVAFSLVLMQLVLAESVWQNTVLLGLAALCAVKVLFTHQLIKTGGKYEYP